MAAMALGIGVALEVHQMAWMQWPHVVAIGQPKVHIESVTMRQVVWVVSQMPFAETGCSVPCDLQISASVVSSWLKPIDAFGPNAPLIPTRRW